MSKKFAAFIVSIIIIFQLVVPNYSFASPPPPPPVSNAPIFQGSASEHVLLLSGGGTLTSWGNNEFGQCGYTGENISVENPYYLPEFANVIQVAAGGTHSLALDSDGYVWSWGNNNCKQLGRNTVAENIEKVDNITSKITQIAAGQNHSLALDENGDVWVWGDNRKCQLGYLGENNTAKMLILPEKAKYIAAKNDNTLIVGVSNTVYSCGDNEYGQLGYSSEKAYSEIERVNLPNDLTINKVSMGKNHAIAYTERNGEKQIYAWGDNSRHQLGVNNLEKTNTPVIVYTSEYIADIFTGDYCNIVEADTEICWGSGLAYYRAISSEWQNDYSSEIINTPVSRQIPRQIIAIGSNETIAYSDYSIEVNGKHQYNIYRLASLTPTNDIYYSDLMNNPQYELKLNFIEFKNSEIDTSDISIESGGTIAMVQYVDSRECGIKLDKYSFNKSQSGIIEPHQYISLYLKDNVITTGVGIITNAINLWYYGSSNRSIIVNNGDAVIANEGEEDGTEFFISLEPTTHWKSFPYYEKGKTNGVNDDWNLGMTFSNMPTGISIGDVNFGENGLVWKKVTLVGNSLIDYDSRYKIDITYLYNSIDEDIYGDIKMGEVNKNDIHGLTGTIELNGVDDPESIQISLSEPIVLGKEEGAEIVARISGGTFETGFEHDISNWILDGVQSDVKISSIDFVDNRTAVLKLSGHSSDVYSSDNEVRLLCKGSEYSDSMDYTTMMPIDLQSENSVTFSKQIRQSGGGSISRSTYTVKFDTNGGSEIKSVSAKRNTTINEPEKPTKEGYEFDGWYIDSKYTSKFDFSTKILKTITLYAKWNEKSKVDVANKLILTIGSKLATVWGKNVTNDVAPIIRNNRTMLPARFIAESLGAEVKWNEEKQTVTITKANIEIVITIGAKTALVNGKEVTLDSPAFIENDRTYTPIKFISEQLGAEIEWNGETKQVVITRK